MSTEENEPTLGADKSKPGVIRPDNAENLRTAYRELCTSYRAIDDFRAKLLGFLPLATGTGIFLLLDKFDVDPATAKAKGGLLMAVGAMGFLVTLGLFFFEIFGIKKCGALIEAGKQMEDSMRIRNGQFERPQNVAWLINEPFASGVIYPTVLAAWTFFFLIFARPEANPCIPIVVFFVGCAWTLIYDFVLRRDSKRRRSALSEASRC